MFYCWIQHKAVNFSLPFITAREIKVREKMKCFKIGSTGDRTEEG